jgi:hypothetical protein
MAQEHGLRKVLLLGPAPPVLGTLSTFLLSNRQILPLVSAGVVVVVQGIAQEIRHVMDR